MLGGDKAAMGEAADWAALLEAELTFAGATDAREPDRDRHHQSPQRRRELPIGEQRRTSPRLAEAARAGAHAPQTARATGAATGRQRTLNFFGRAVAAGSNSFEASVRFTAEGNITTGVPDAAPHAAGASHPALAGMERERAKKRKAPEGPRGRTKAVRSTKETSVSVKQRLTEFPGEGLKEAAGKLFCEPCREELTNLKESLKRHIKSSKHITALSIFEKRISSNKKLHTDLADVFKEAPHEHGVCNSLQPMYSLCMLM